MKLTSRKVPTFGEQRRAGRQNDRLQAPALRSRYATIGKLQIDLSFSGTSGSPPSPQSHSYYPPARAFFRFACPCSECDGEFDLSGQVDELAEVKRPSVRTAAGRLGCEGMHFRERATATPCPVVLSWRLVIVRSD
ncbi:MAG: hypothetical protein JSR15_00830 [Proteobacteria bacterium]|nr:hypothetical protein [Pseudomonadota bacterium]